LAAKVWDWRWEPGTGRRPKRVRSRDFGAEKWGLADGWARGNFSGRDVGGAGFWRPRKGALRAAFDLRSRRAGPKAGWGFRIGCRGGDRFPGPRERPGGRPGVGGAPYLEKMFGAGTGSAGGGALGPAKAVAAQGAAKLARGWAGEGPLQTRRKSGWKGPRFSPKQYLGGNPRRRGPKRKPAVGAGGGDDRFAFESRISSEKKNQNTDFLLDES